ncbi:MAG: NAD(P)-dependent oxidoreductase [Planctomycetota bacterium]
MTVLVTGATGFVGRHVVPHLLRDGQEVVVATRSPIDESGLAWVDQVRRVELDLGDADLEMDLPASPETVVHLAWGNLQNFRSIDHLDVELPRAKRFLRRLADGGCKRIIVAGTCLEYGLQNGCLGVDASTKPVTAYGLAKVQLHEYLRMLQASRMRETGQTFELTWARIFYLHGEGQSPRSLLPLLRSAIQRGDKTFPMSGGEQLRDFLPATEVGRMLADLAWNTTGAGTVNICKGTPISVRRLIEEHIASWDAKIDLQLGVYPYPDYEPLAFWGDRTPFETLRAKP